MDWEYFLPDSFEAAAAPSPDDDEDFYEKVPVAVSGFQDQLKEQLRMETSDPDLLKAGEYLIGCIDEDGYLHCVLEEAVGETGIEMEVVEEALTLVQSLEPAGVAARDLKECLQLQLRAKGLENSLAARMVSECMEDLKNKRYRNMKKCLGADDEELRAAMEVIASLSPRPGRQLVKHDTEYITPDLLVDEVDGDFVVMLNESDTPRVRINRSYREIMDESDGPKAKDYVTKKLRAARWIVQSIEQRRQTMIKVMEAIVKLQREFFEKGIGHLKPMTLQQVADEISMHESTVSRVTNKKYVQTPQGLFELKFFFSSGLRTLHGDDVSARSAKDVIVHLVEHEDKTNPMSDQAIADKLAERGIMISRRAVAKYREQLTILPARLRKKI